MTSAASPHTAGVGQKRRLGRVGGIALIVAPLLWLVGAVAFRAQVGGFYEHYEEDVVAAVNAIAGQRPAWLAQSVMFFAGTAAAVVGFAILSRLLAHGRAAGLARVGLVGSVVVAAANALVFVLRLGAPTDGVQSVADVPGLLIPAHTGWLNLVTLLLTLATVAVYAVALFRSGLGRATGVVVATLAGLVLVALVISGSLPPVVVYPLAAVLGIRMLTWRGDPAR